MKEKNSNTQILLFSLPIFISLLFQQLYYSADSLIIGNILGERSLAAVGAVAGIVYLIVNVSGGITAGYSVRIATAYGNGDKMLVRKETAASVSSSLALGIVFSAMFLVTTPTVLAFLDVPNELRYEASVYLRVLFAGLPITLLNNMQITVLRSIGESKKPSLFLSVSIVVNIILDFVFIGWFGLKVLGAAVATVISQLLSLVLSTAVLYRNYSDYAPMSDNFTALAVRNYYEINKIGIPYGLQFLITSIGITIVQKAINIYGSATIAGFSVANKLHAIFAQAHVSIGTGLMTFTAHDVGAGETEKPFKRAREILPVFMLLAVVNGTILYISCRMMVHLFTQNPTQMMVDATAVYIRTVVWFYPFLTAIFLVRNVLTGLGKTQYSLFGAMVEFVIRVIVSMVLTDNRGYRTVCAADPLAWIGGLITLLCFYFYEYRKNYYKVTK